MTADVPRLTALSHGAGCACKLGPEELADVLSRLDRQSAPDLLVGTDTGDDAAVWRTGEHSALVATTDFFTPIVDDPRAWGAVAAANAVSDVYAMGGSPLFALNVVGWPRDTLSLDLLEEVLQGAAEIADRGGWVIAGGHTIDSLEPLYGQAVIGQVDPDQIMTNLGGKAGDAIVLTKPIGTGLLATAVKRNEPSAVAAGGELHDWYLAAIASMTKLNVRAADVAREHFATSATDVTGFGLLGHLHKLAAASGVAAEVAVAAVPLLPGAEQLLDEGYVAGGTKRNARYVTPALTGEPDARTVTLLSDAQTSGGLLFSCAPGRANDAAAELRAEGHDAAVIGHLVRGTPGAITLVDDE